jgi:1,4-dihydroxy-2-naphthoate polyprenyltransferase
MEQTLKSEQIVRSGSDSPALSRDKLSAWYQASRAPFFVATLIPLVLAAVIAHREGDWNPVRWLVICFASFLVHMNTNLANDYFDHLAGADSGDSIGGSRVLQEGKLTLSAIRRAMIVFYFLALACGFWITWVSQVWWLPLVMVFSFFSSLFYTAPPVRYGYLGLGELSVGLNMGPIMVAGTASALANGFVPRAVWLSIPIGFMVAMILYYQSLPDIEADEAVGKRTIAVRLGKPAAIWGVRFFVALTLLSVILLVYRGLLHPAALCSLLTVVLACRTDRMIAATENWKDLHDRGGQVRLFYLINGLILILAVGIFG